jgi:hypothetical protein
MEWGTFKVCKLAVIRLMKHPRDRTVLVSTKYRMMVVKQHTLDGRTADKKE